MHHFDFKIDLSAMTARGVFHEGSNIRKNDTLRQILEEGESIMPSCVMLKWTDT